MVYLGLDLGSKTLGLSISDRTATIATSLEVLRYNTYDELLLKLESIVTSRNVDAFVLGNPLNLNGSVSKRSEETFKFKDLLIEKFNKEVIMQDERLSTVEAERMLISNDTKRKNRKKVIDKIAATIILQGYLDRRNK
ncbi:MAG: Holliday junction resolvase RuvX [Bacilli bacterium]|jgi:putative Holliday junction resolvase|nr:Holliday junction resolvase RuvX [Bacilli bacterium]